MIPEQSGTPSVKGSELFTKSSSAEGIRLRAINKIMTQWRICARTARLTPFHTFLHRALDQGRVVKCLTRNFDGFESRDRLDLLPKILMLHGDNRILTCLNTSCGDMVGDQVEKLDGAFMNEEDVPCPDCMKRRKL
jgi:NAD-dependent SIR2 family protein deacetylase